MTTTAVCIPTYKRPHLLRLLIEDLRGQPVQPAALIIVDGDPASGEVRDLLSTMQREWQIVYIPSNHGNLAYQRYLGWRAAADLKMEVLVYFDDDERLFDTNILACLTARLGKDEVVGVGCPIRFGSTTDGSDASRMRNEQNQSWLVRLFGSGKKIAPGELTPTGHRKKLIDDPGVDYLETHWLHGGVMAYWMNAISQKTFSEDLFALDHIRCGLGEDTFLSRRIGAGGKLLYTFRVVVDHPNADTPKSYPYQAYQYAYAATYSRRFLNDHYRVYDPPTTADRWALVKSYLGNIFLAWAKALKQPAKLNLALARGITLGAVHGILRPPTAQRLTPDIDWWADAEAALKNKVEF